MTVSTSASARLRPSGWHGRRAVAGTTAGRLTLDAALGLLRHRGATQSHGA